MIKTKETSSFVGVKLRELNRVLKEDAIIVVSRKYAEQLELDSNPVYCKSKNLETNSKQLDVE